MLEIRKPFDPSISEEEEKKIEKNEEKEEKPVESTSETSEETHGGEESTESIEDSENPSETENEQQNEQQSSSKNEELNSSDSSDESQGSQESKEEAGSSLSSDPADTSENIESPNSEGSEGEINDNQENAEDNDVSENGKEAEFDSEQYGNGDMSETDEGFEAIQDSENNEDDSTEGNEDDQEYEDQDNQSYSHIYNTEEVVIVDANKKPISAKYFATAFWGFIESFAEEKTKIYDSTEPEEYNVKKLMFRAYERKPLNAYIQKRVRETVILILDNSGSMSWWANNLKMLASLALDKKDVEIYIAPNGEITAQLIKNGRIQVSHDKFMKKMNGRKIIYVGDFDGADTPIELSWRNDVVWICPEDRYRRFLSHDWVHYDESRFHGVFIRAFTLEEMFEGLRRITRFSRLFIDLHEDQRFSDDSYD